jgi:hypothetical protein
MMLGVVTPYLEATLRLTIEAPEVKRLKTMR